MEIVVWWWECNMGNAMAYDPLVLFVALFCCNRAYFSIDKFWLWLGTSPVHSSVFLHNKEIFCYFGSCLVNSGRFQFTRTVSTTFLLVELVVIKHGRHVVSCSYRQPRGGCFSYSWRSPKGCAMHPTLLKASNITSIEHLLISCHFEC